MDIRRIIQYIYVDVPLPPWMRKKANKDVDEAQKRINEMLANIREKLSKVASPVIAQQIEGMMASIKGAMDSGNMAVAESAAADLEKFSTKAADVTTRLKDNIDKAKTLFWSMPPETRKALGVIIKAAQKQLESGADLSGMEAMNKQMEKALHLAKRVADAGPANLHEVAHELQALGEIASDVADMGTDHLKLSDEVLKRSIEAAKLKQQEREGKAPLQVGEAATEAGQKKMKAAGTLPIAEKKKDPDAMPWAEQKDQVFIPKR